MSNMEKEQFTYDIFKQAYDQDPAIQNLVKDFNEKGVKLGKDKDVDVQPQTGGDTVSQMAKRATDL